MRCSGIDGNSEDFYCVPSCSVMASIGKHLFGWTEIICTSTKIATIDCISIEQKQICSSHNCYVFVSMIMLLLLLQ